MKQSYFRILRLFLLHPSGLAPEILFKSFFCDPSRSSSRHFSYNFFWYQNSVFPGIASGIASGIFSGSRSEDPSEILHVFLSGVSTEFSNIAPGVSSVIFSKIPSGSLANDLSETHQGVQLDFWYTSWNCFWSYFKNSFRKASRYFFFSSAKGPPPSI